MGLSLDDPELLEGNMDALRSSPPNPATKVKRTYGHRKEPSNAEEVTTNTSYTQSTLFKNSKFDASETQSSDEDGEPSVSGDVFGWKKKLADIDKEFEDEADSDLTKHHRNITSHQKDRFLFSEKLEENITSGDAPVSSPTSPQHLHLINTPKSHSSPTPPTSDGGGSAPRIFKRKSPKLSFESDGGETEDQPSVRKRDKGKSKEKSKKIKGLSKKEMKEMRREQARLLADQVSAIPRRNEPKQMPMTRFLATVAPTFNITMEEPMCAVSSDPIQPFTSSPCQHAPLHVPVVPNAPAEELPPDLDSDDKDCLPDATSLLQIATEKRMKRDEKALQKQTLAAHKRRVLELQSRVTDRTKGSNQDEDDELEVVSNVEAQRDKAPKTKKENNNNLASLVHSIAGSRKAAQDGSGTRLKDKERLELAAKPTFSQRRSRSDGPILSQAGLKALLRHGMMTQGQNLREQKEREWVSKGGRVKGKDHHGGEGGTSLQQLLSRVNEAGSSVEAGENDFDDDEDEDGSDYEYAPDNRGSASPTPVDQESTLESDASDEGDDAELEGHDTEQDDLSRAQDVEDGSDGGIKKQARRPIHRVQRVLDSDSESEENTEHRSMGRVLVPDTSFVDDSVRTQTRVLAHRSSLSSLDDGSVNEDDKENDTSLMFDHGEDKENTAVPRHVPVGLSSERPKLGRRQGSGLHALVESTKRCLSMSPLPDDLETDVERRSTRLQPRTPGNLEDPFALSPPAPIIANENSVGASKWGIQHRASPSSSSPQPLQPAFGETVGIFSQFFDDEDGFIPTENENEGNIPPMHRLKTAFRGSAMVDPLSSRRSLSPSDPQPLQVHGLSDLFSLDEPNYVNRMKRPGNIEELSLTLDTKLQPAIEVATQVRQKADAIFEKEQNYVLEDARKKMISQPELYITENGLLTQTKPDVSSPLIYRPLPPSPGSDTYSPPRTQQTSSTQRQPLGTLSFTSLLSSPSDRQPLTRLAKGKWRDSPTGRSSQKDVHRSKLSPSPQSSNNFKVLIGNQKKKKMVTEASVYIGNEAQESDDDEMFGLGDRRKPEDDESDDEDPDTQLEGLVDDAEMDDETLAADKVLEKVKEIQDADDAEVQKLHQAAVEGKLRGKRRGGIDMQDSDSDDDDDEEARRLRSKMYKKRKIEGDSLEALGQDEKSRSFHDAYYKDLEEGNDDFLHLVEDDMDVANGDEDEHSEPEVVTTSELKEELREAARSKQPRQAFDPRDTSWAEDEYLTGSDDDSDVKEVNLRTKPMLHKRPALGHVDFDSNLEPPKRSRGIDDRQYSDRLTSWAKEQSSSRSLVTGRSAAAVTGHAQMTASHMNKSIPNASGKGLKSVKAQSMLGVLKDKQSRFGD